MNLIELQDHELRVPIQRIHAEIHTERDEVSGHLLLQPLATVENVFDDEAPFVPVEIDGRARLLARTSIAVIVVDEQMPTGTCATLRAISGCQTIVVRLTNGAVVEGNIMLSPMLQRTLDVLNQPTKSFAIHAQGKVLHIAKAHVLRVEEAT